MLRVYDQTDENSETVVIEDMFGANLTITTDLSLVQELSARFQGLGLHAIRFPGGSVTEWHFDISDIAGGSHDRTEGSFEGARVELIPFSKFLNFAATIEKSVTLVIPTINGFSQSASEALLSGDFGNRLVTETYLENVADFVAMAVLTSQQKGVTIDAFEIGNELMASGRMTASEYGQLAAAVAVVVERTLDSLSIARPAQADIVVQTLSAAGIYSPNGTTTLYVDESTGFIYEPHEIDGPNVPEVSQLTEISIPSQGTARQQNIAIISAFEQDHVIIHNANGQKMAFDTANAVDAIDGVTEHYFLDGGFDAVDSDENYGFNQLELWRQSLPMRGASLPELDFYITEWNVRRNGDVDEANNRGLQQAATNVAMFYEMVTHDVTTAYFWPSIFDQSSSVTLIHQNRELLTIAGEAFSQLPNTLGMSPFLGFREKGIVDIHGFQNETKAFIILSERSGTENRMQLDLSDVLKSANYRVSWIELWDGGAGGQDESVEPVKSTTELVDHVSPQELESFLVTLQSWSILYMSIEVISTGGAGRVEAAEADAARRIVTGSDAHDNLHGGLGDDTMRGLDGDDLLNGGGGDDHIGGGFGDDTISGGDGDDLMGAGFGDDSVSGGFGHDVVAGGAGNDTLDGGDGNDSMSGSYGHDFITAGNGADDIGGGTGRDTIDAGAGRDRVGGGEGDDSISGGAGNDFLAGGGREDVIDGGIGNDTINGGAGNDVMTGGAGADQFVFSAFFDGEADVITDFEDGIDRFFIRIINPDSGEENLSNGNNGLAGFLAALGVVDTAAGAQLNVNGNTILVEGIVAPDLTVDDFQFL